MKINVLLSPLNADELFFTGKTTIVIDVLRATTVINYALHNDSKEIIPVGSIDFAMKISGNAHGGQSLLCGERNTKIIEGFDLGNSPQDYTKEVVEGKSIIFFTTNGSKAIVRAKFSENLLTCSFNNLSAIAKYIGTLNEDVQILCAGSNGMYCIEDTSCAGHLIKEINNVVPNIQLSDAARSCVAISNEFAQDVEQMLRTCEHGKLLIENGFEEDLKHCAEINTMNIVPLFNNGALKVSPAIPA
jgi:2-phosphosulfolactate phosphatase